MADFSSKEDHRFCAANFYSEVFEEKRDSTEPYKSVSVGGPSSHLTESVAF